MRDSRSENIAIGKTRIAITSPEVDKFSHVGLIHINSIEELPKISPLLTDGMDGFEDIIAAR